MRGTKPVRPGRRGPILTGLVAAASLGLAARAAAQCDRFTYTQEYNGQVSIALEVLGIEPSPTANEFLVHYRVEASDDLRGDRIKVQAEFNVEMANGKLKSCQPLGELPGGGTYTTRVVLPIAGPAPGGKYTVHYEIGLTGDLTDSPANNVDTFEREYGPRLAVTDPQAPGGEVAMTLRNQGDDETGEILVRKFFNQNGRFFASDRETLPSLGAGESRRYAFPGDPSILYDLRFFDPAGRLMAFTEIRGETYSDDGQVDTGSPDFPPPTAGAIIPTATTLSLPGGGIALGDNDPKVTVRLTSKKKRFRRRRWYVNADVELGREQRPVVLSWEVTKYRRPLGWPELTVTEDGTYTNSIKMTRSHPEGAVAIAVDPDVTDLDTTNNRAVIGEEPADAAEAGPGAAIQFTPQRGDVIFRPPGEGQDGIPVTVVIKVHAMGLPNSVDDERWSVDEGHLADNGFREVTQAPGPELAEGDLQFEFSAVLDRDSAFARGARSGVETTLGIPLKIEFDYDFTVDGQREVREHREDVGVTVEAKSTAPAYNLVPELFIIDENSVQGPFPADPGEAADIQEFNHIHFRVLNTGNVPVPAGTRFRAELRWTNGGPTPDGSAWRQTGEFEAVDYEVTEAIPCGAAVEVFVHDPGEWVCDRLDPDAERPSLSSGIIAELRETDLTGEPLSNNTGGVPADIETGTDNFFYHNMNYRPLCEN